MIFETYLSFKYLFCKRKEKFISLIAFLSISGVAISVMALIIVISVMSGFSESLKEKIIGMNPHVLISSHESIDGFESLIKDIEALPDVLEAYPFVEGQAMMNFENKVYGVFLKGLPLEEKEIRGVKKYIKKGRSKIKNGEIIIGSELASRLGLKMHDQMNIMSPAYGQVFGDFPSMLNFSIEGVFKSEMFEYDNSLVFMSLGDAQKLYGLNPGQVHGVGVDINEIEKAHQYKSRIADFLTDGLFVKSWMNVNKNHNP